MFEPNHCSLIAPPVGMLGGVPLPHHNHHTIMPCSSTQLPSSPPRSSRNTEKRRERSKVAARCRRGKESEIFTELSLSLPVPESSRSNLDKASVMRLTLCDLKLKEMIESSKGIKKDKIVKLCVFLGNVFKIINYHDFLYSRRISIG